ncbi:MAG: TRAP transporter substrate-binding protein DctP [Nisaea sp.]|uniref:TRAP transporter substrate-binding protein DctP n=1 Tax=Nisaea sp. TaxID=2024842 RepID=UPI001B104787|nr:TRAP transporter substrate-binding protein DctP [Nisaea sp.]MBO6560168.1 TRAP transporter substrate-binding protein DctP [Nisaea sp.]
MTFKTALRGAAAAVALMVSGGVAAADVVEIIYSDTVQETDRRSGILKEHFGQCLGDGFEFKPYFGATLFKQGTELTAMQRGNLDMANLASYDFENQVPSASILGIGYLFRGYDHMRKVFDGDTMNGLFGEMEEKTGVKVLANPYIGTRHVNIRGDKKIMTPADMQGIKLRMPGGEGWQFLGKALGANPTPVAFTEVYTALQTGTVDGQDNPLPTNKQMKFYEVTNQIILTSHRVATNIFAMSGKKWNSLNEAQQAKVKECAMKFQAAMDASTLGLEKEMSDFFVQQGLKIYTPDIEAFRNHALEMYKNSDYSKNWPAGLLESINAN